MLNIEFHLTTPHFHRRVTVAVGAAVAVVRTAALVVGEAHAYHNFAPVEPIETSAVAIVDRYMCCCTTQFGGRKQPTECGILRENRIGADIQEHPWRWPLSHDMKRHTI